MKNLTKQQKSQFMASPEICDAPNNQNQRESAISLVKYLFIGVAFGIVFVKAEIISWFRIQEMFHLHSFHMYGIIGSAIITGMLSVWIIKKYKIRTLAGEEVLLKPKTFNKGQIFGGILFGLGWAITGACPGPLFAQIGSGFLAICVTLLSAIAGTWVYGRFKENLPH